MLSFDDDTPIPRIISMIAPILNQELKRFSDGGGKGAEAFGEAIVTALKDTGLCKRVWMDVECIGVHPSNREGAMLIAIDVHDLLKKISFRGWSWQKVNIMACSIPSKFEPT